MFDLDSEKQLGRPAFEGLPAGLELVGVQKRYGHRVALAGVDLRLRRGETLGLLGPNGAGKSTLMKIVVGALDADHGSVSIGGLPASARAARGKLGFAPQDLALYANLSAEENLELFGRLHGLRGRRLRERVELCLELAGLEDRRRDRVRTFSGGMARRLNLSCAIVHEPELVLLDEPTVGIDPQSRNHIFATLERLREAGLTLLYSTHYMEEAERLCDRVAVVDRGKLLAEGTVSELVQLHGGDFVVRAIVASSMPPELAELGTRRGHEWTFVTSEPWTIVRGFATGKLRVASLNVQGPSLESVFLKLTGRSLRD